VRTVDHSIRNNQVLAATVSAYIQTGNPVSSHDLMNFFGLSSATIRNILSELEEHGYLYQPHTSAGRVPTDKGYRYYVDFLMGEFSLSEEQKESIISEYKKRLSSFEDVLEKTSEMIARLTHYTAIISFSEWRDRILYTGLSNIIKEPEFHDNAKLQALVHLLEEKSQLLHLLNQDQDKPLTVFIGGEISCPNISEECSLVVSSYHKGKKGKGKIAVLGPRRMSYEQTVSTLAFISNTLNTLLDEF